MLAGAVEQASEIAFDRYLAEAVFEPLGMGSSALAGGAEAAGFGGSRRWPTWPRSPPICCGPALVSQQMHADAVAVQFPGLAGVLPGYGTQRPNDWGLGFELRDGKSPHWTGSRNSARTFGHFGQSGTFIWVDPAADLALVVLTDRDFGDWAHPLWPALSDGVLREFGTH